MDAEKVKVKYASSSENLDEVLEYGGLTFLPWFLHIKKNRPCLLKRLTPSTWEKKGKPKTMLIS